MLCETELFPISITAKFEIRFKVMLREAPRLLSDSKHPCAAVRWRKRAARLTVPASMSNTAQRRSTPAPSIRGGAPPSSDPASGAPETDRHDMRICCIHYPIYLAFLFARQGAVWRRVAACNSAPRKLRLRLFCGNESVVWKNRKGSGGSRALGNDGTPPASSRGCIYNSPRDGRCDAATRPGACRRE